MYVNQGEIMKLSPTCNVVFSILIGFALTPVDTAFAKKSRSSSFKSSKSRSSGWSSSRKSSSRKSSSSGWGSSSSSSRSSVTSSSTRSSQSSSSTRPSQSSSSSRVSQTSSSTQRTRKTYESTFSRSNVLARKKNNTPSFSRSNPKTNTVTSASLKGPLKNAKSGDRVYKRVPDKHKPVNKYVSRSEAYGMYHPKTGYVNPGYRQSAPHVGGAAPTIIRESSSGFGFFETYLMISLLTPNSNSGGSVVNNYYGSGGESFAAEPEYQQMEQRFSVDSNPSDWVSAGQNASFSSLFKVPEDMTVAGCELKYGGTLILEQVAGSTAQLFYMSPNVEDESDAVLEGECEQYAAVNLAVSDLSLFNSKFVNTAKETVSANQLVVAEQLGGAEFETIEVIEKDPNTIYFCGGSPTGNYTKTVNYFSNMVRGYTVKLITTSGSWDNLEKLENGICDAAIIQSDSKDLYKEGVPTSLVVDNLKTTDLYDELGHLVCRKSLGLEKPTIQSLLEYAQYNYVSVNTGSMSSGSTVTWSQMERTIGESMSDINTYTVGSGAAADEVFEQEKDCFFTMIGRSSTFLADVSDRSEDKRERDQLQLISLDIEEMDESIYSIEKIGDDVYPGLYKKGRFVGRLVDLSPKVLTVKAQLAVNKSIDPGKQRAITEQVRDVAEIMQEETRRR